MNMSSEIIIRSELRPCYVNGKKALFHRWSSDTNEYAIVEYEDGVVDQVLLNTIRFVDRRIYQFDFDNGGCI